MPRKLANSVDPDQTAPREQCGLGLHCLLRSNCPKTLKNKITVMTLSFRTDRSGQTVQTQIRLLLEEQSDQGLHCLLFHLHLFDKIS